MGQYFDNDPSLPHQNIQQRFALLGENFTLESDRGVFSKEGLDDGTRLLLETIAKAHLGRTILDLGCGIGSLGLLLAHFDPERVITLADVNQRALELCKRNAESLGVGGRCDIRESDVYSNITSTYDTIVTNPPIRAGKRVTYAMYAGALSHLNEDGRLILVIRKKQGADSCQAYLESLFSSVEKVASKKGYRVLIARK
ncbi:MAG: class I SAM-dependent methyltransferase [Bacilli bacterium]|nr:class I SAM-dependent methyltransferase [Bacilli bacterium]